MSLFKTLNRREKEDLLSAIKGNKYWNLDAKDRDFIYVVALTRARIRIDESYCARATHIGSVTMSKEVGKFCRRYRILLVNRRMGKAVCVMTWKAFNKYMMKYRKQIHDALMRGKLPPYMNSKNINGILDPANTLSSSYKHQH